MVVVEALVDVVEAPIVVVGGSAVVSVVADCVVTVVATVSGEVDVVADSPDKTPAHANAARMMGDAATEGLTLAPFSHAP